MLDVIFDRYAHDLGYAYNQMLKELAELLLRKKIYPDATLTHTGGIRLVPYGDLLDKESAVYDDVVAITGRCGGRCGAAMKRAKTRLVVTEAEKLRHLDMTGEVLSTLAKATIGRGVNRSARAQFATKGRTAINKSTILRDHPEEIQQWIESTKHLVSLFNEKSVVLKNSLATQWLEQWDALKQQIQEEKPSKEPTNNETHLRLNDS